MPRNILDIIESWTDEQHKATAVYFMKDEDFAEVEDDMSPQVQKETFVTWVQVNE